MAKILGIDVGTNSLGLSVRDEEISNKPDEQIVFSSVNLFKSGVGNGQSGEFSFAAQRTAYRRQRLTYKVRRYRKWATLAVLIENGCCPLSMEELDRWRKYDKEQEEHRHYPIDNNEFQRWISLDIFNNGEKRFKTPYQLRNILATEQLDFSLQENRYILGRVIYHICERRGFRSSKGDTVQLGEQEADSEELKSSEKEKSGILADYMKQHNLPTVGCALYEINKTNRVRCDYQPIRKQLKDEIEYIFDFQIGLDKGSDLFHHIISEKRNEGTIFYKRPLKSQKGNVGMCTLEPSKPRCPQSRPEFEEFRAWSFINSIRFGTGCNKQLPLEMKEALYNDLFIRASNQNFKFERIRTWMEKKSGEKYKWTADINTCTINYKDNTPLSACVVIYRLTELLGEDWKYWSYTTDKEHTDYTNKKSRHQVVYHWEDVWHICLNADDEEPLKTFVETCSIDYAKLVKLWETMPVAYANLSLKAINNINRFLKKGLLYNEACLLAKLPDIFKEKWSDDMERVLTDVLGDIMLANSVERKNVRIANSLIENYKALPDVDRFAYKDYSYCLQKTDYRDIVNAARSSYGEKTWDSFSEEERKVIIENVAHHYQAFFNDELRRFITPTKIDDAIKSFLLDNFEGLDVAKLNRLYHHSQIDYFRPAGVQRIEKGNSVLLRKVLASPKTPSLRNPMALRVLHSLRRKINDLLIEGIIDEDTRIVVEVARELNDANKRWAIKTFQDKRKAQNDEYRRLLGDLFQSEDDVERMRLTVEQHDCAIEGDEAYFEKGKKDSVKKDLIFETYINNLVKKYRLWMEQGCTCIYTGKVISISNLVNGDKFDIEHTIPRSRSYDDSLSNMTLCDSYFNRHVKKNRMPSELDNDTYQKILMRIKPWRERVSDLKNNVAYWKDRTKKAQTKDQKDKAIRQRLLWEMELEYWQKKVDAFLMTEVKTGFRNSQLVDTSIIAKYAMHYLKTVFTHVEVQKGEVTAKFRKILGIQEKDSVKVRDFNYHHAIDAMTLTFIPVAIKRDKLLQLYFDLCEAKEGKQTDMTASDIERLMQLELKKSGIKADFTSIIEKIKSSVLSIYEEKYQSLTPAKRRMRVRGKIVPLRDAEGNIIFETDNDGNYLLDNNGHKVPVAKRWIKGDSVRGELHDKTYYGAITQYDDKTIKYVVRRPLLYAKTSNDAGFKDWEDIKKVIVNKELVDMMKSQFPEGTSFKDAFNSTNGIWMMKKDGTRDKRIRHIRCYASVTNPIKVRKQTYPSSKEYKNFFYARNGENIAYALYESGSKRCFECVSLLNAAKISSASGTNNGQDIFATTIFRTVGRKEMEFSRLFTIFPGQMVILKGDEDSVDQLSMQEVSIRLYQVRRIYNPTDGRLQLQHHLESRSDKQLSEAFPKEQFGKAGINGFSTIKLNEPSPRLLLAIGNQNFWVEGQDFVIKNGKVVKL